MLLQQKRARQPVGGCLWLNKRDVLCVHPQQCPRRWRRSRAQREACKPMAQLMVACMPAGLGRLLVCVSVYVCVDARAAVCFALWCPPPGVHLLEVVWFAVF